MVLRRQEGLVGLPRHSIIRITWARLQSWSLDSMRHQKKYSQRDSQGLKWLSVALGMAVASLDMG